MPFSIVRNSTNVSAITPRKNETNYHNMNLVGTKNGVSGIGGWN
jgi:hypothetical protein